MTTTETPPARYRIAEVAERSGFSASTLRYYEQAGVLDAPERTPAGYRLYSDRDLERLRLIARAKDLGCTLEETTELVRAWDSDECGPVKHRLRALVHGKVAEVEVHLAEQAAFATQLRATADALAGRPLDGPCDDTCGCTTTSAGDVGGGCGTGCGAGGDAVVLGRPAGTGASSDVPIACSLSGTDMATRIDDWQHVLSTVTARPSVPGGLRLELAGRSGLAELARLVEAEQTCCPFFSFAITIDQRGLALEVTAPTDGQDLLATIFGDPR
jgi:DNA-binding transcriptional MerR regulator